MVKFSEFKICRIPFPLKGVLSSFIPLLLKGFDIRAPLINRVARDGDF
jgi:hypothetical protein